MRMKYFPPSLSQNKQLRNGTKSDLLGCLEDLYPTVDSNYPTVDAIVIDGAAMVHMLKPGATKTFTEYAEQVVRPYIENKLQNVTRLDVVFDQYFPNSLKSATREQRGKGVRKRVIGNSKLPSNWAGFLKVGGNKTELFSFLSQYMQQIVINEDKQLYVTHGASVLTNPQLLDIIALAPCTHEETDSRIFLHVADISNAGHTKGMTRMSSLSPFHC